MRGYSAHDTARREPEPPKAAGNGRRSPFARDRARVLHSAALRRLAGKTQVVGPGEGAEISGVPRTRLTHSLEVAQIGAGIAEELGADPDVVDTAGLAHDIGHPPFGHNGERALDEFGAACGGFEGNAQTLRILMRLEPKVDGTRGLNLTRATLDAACKYPWPRRPGLRKFGVYADDAACFAWVRDGRAGPVAAASRRRSWTGPTTSRTPCTTSRTASSPGASTSLAGRPRRARRARRARRPALRRRAGRAQAAADALLALPVVDAVRGFDAPTAPAAAHIALKRLTSELVGRFAVAATDATRATLRRRPAASLRRRPRRPARGAGRGRAAEGGRTALRDERPAAPRHAGPPARAARRAGRGVAGRCPGALDPVLAAGLARRPRRRRRACAWSSTRSRC